MVDSVARIRNDGSTSVGAMTRIGSGVRMRIYRATMPSPRSLPESAKKVGAQSPTKIPKRSAWAFDSASSPPVKNQIAIDPMIEANPRIKQRFDRFLQSVLFTKFPLNQSVRFTDRFMKCWCVQEKGVSVHYRTESTLGDSSDVANLDAVLAQRT